MVAVDREELFVAAHRQMNKYSNDRSKKSLAFDAAKLQQVCEAVNAVPLMHVGQLTC